jgi:hypothetical protein
VKNTVRNMPLANRALFFLTGLLLLALCAAGNGQVMVGTWHNDNLRTGQNIRETILTPSNVNSSLFGKLFSHVIDSYAYAQPLYLSSVTIPNKGIHNVVYVATQHDSVYAFDADSNTGTNAAPLWQVSFINPSAGITTLTPSDVSCGDMPPEVGIAGTPVINPTSGTLYVLARTNENGTFIQRLHALDVTTGAEKFGGPVLIQASYKGASGTIAFDPLLENQRTGLLLLNGLVYITWGSSCDFGDYHGWVIAYDSKTLKQTAAWVTTPNGTQGAIWQSTAAPAADSSFNTYFATGNGTFDADSGGSDYGDSIVKLAFPTAGTFTATDYFTPFDQASLNAVDKDLGSGGPLLLPNQPLGAPHQHLLVQAGKEGTVYVVDRDNMGHFNSSNNNQIVQNLSGLVTGLWSNPGWWNNTVYFGGSRDSLSAVPFNVNTGLLATSPSSKSSTLFGYPGPTPSISANGATNGIVWALQNEAFQTNGPTVLHAYDATNLAKELYNSSQRPNRDYAGAAVKFTVPTIANGKVYVGSEANLTVFGLLPPDFTLGASPLAQSVKQGQSIDYTLKIVAQGGYSGTVSLSVTGLPANSRAVFDPLTITTSGTASLQVGTTTGTPTGPFTLTVTGTDSAHSLAHSASVTMTVTH